MSQLLNIALFLRNNPLKHQLSSLEKLSLFTLAARIGNNTRTWISQVELSAELGVHLSTLKRVLAKLIKYDLILIKKEWRNNHYYLNEEKILTAHREAVNEKESELSQLTDELSDPLSQLTSELITAHPRAVINDFYFPEDRAVSGLEGNELLLKEKSKLTIKKKETLKTCVRDVHFENFWKEYPRKENKKKAHAIWKRQGLDEKADLLIHDVMNRKKNHQSWQAGYIPHATTYLNGERWNDEIREKKNETYSSSCGVNARQASLQRGWDIIKNWNSPGH